MYESKSIVYCAVIAESERVNKDIYGYHHAFVLEQFFNIRTRSVCFRIYQSWQCQATVSDDILNRLYGDLGEGFWNHEDISVFLKNLETLCCHKEYEYAKMAYMQCFGYFDGTSPSIVFENQSRTLTGLSVRYISSEIDPESCFGNLVTFLNSHPQLKSQILRAQ